MMLSRYGFYGLVLLSLIVRPVLAAVEPIVEVIAPQTPVTVGRPSVIRVTVLVPTWFSKPVYFEPVESINLINLATSKSSYPTSRRVGADTWSGVVKEYTVIPMVEGEYDVTIPELTLHFADQNARPQVVKVSPQPATIVASVPVGAKSLQPYVIADDLTLKQSVQIPDQLQVGDNISRELQVTVKGSSAMFVPELLANPDWARSYLSNPQTQDRVSETDGGLIGSRREIQNIRLVAAGEFVLPAVQLQYYQPDTESIVTVSEPAIALVVAPAPLTPRQWAVRMAALCGLVLLVLVLLRVLWLYSKRIYRSEPWQYWLLLRSCKRPSRKALARLAQWYQVWQQRLTTSRFDQEYHELVVEFELSIYLRQDARENKKVRASKLRALRKSCKGALHRDELKLLPLNP
ncbi:hypothetical protein QWI17_21690 [Gilvimarinus sp. SDUM040013]|uniref:Protein BatD n=1 Tax=Gilvimarinus gilvus TaxID=3058038 RepID=A0ABU4RUU8_9GAMM|nr:hypothetical protein [Gilvimarinus sp. SDUM040013]MDO3388474.1 hypothetical protein [Gilvimarinus sp. SDUM040013]MDX6848654.1 hypothetical protein [Gilvimarinus sp. SDUM040013]